MNESETLIRSFTIILAVHQPYSIMLHVTYVCIMQADLQERERESSLFRSCSRLPTVFKDRRSRETSKIFFVNTFLVFVVRREGQEMTISLKHLRKEQQRNKIQKNKTQIEIDGLRAC